MADTAPTQSNTRAPRVGGLQNMQTYETKHFTLIDIIHRLCLVQLFLTAGSCDEAVICLQSKETIAAKLRNAGYELSAVM